MSISKLIAVSLLSVGFGIASANASTITNDFAFTDQSNAIVASGSFSYDSAKTGTLGYSDLTAFTINLLGESYDLTFAKALDPGIDYIYFGYNVSTNTFVPGLAPSIYGNLTSILAGINTSTFEGFFFSPLAIQGGDNADGTFTEYRTGKTLTAVEFTISPAGISAIPEPSTWIMMLIGFLGLASLAYRRRENFGLQAV